MSTKDHFSLILRVMKWPPSLLAGHPIKYSTMKAVEEYLHMRHHTRSRRFALIFSVVIAAVMIVIVRNSAAAPSFSVFGPTSTTCDKTGQIVAAGYQGSS